MLAQESVENSVATPFQLRSASRRRTIASTQSLYARVVLGGNCHQATEHLDGCETCGEDQCEDQVLPPPWLWAWL